MQRLNQILSESQCDGELHTHVLLSGGKVSIAAANAVKFWSCYNECVLSRCKLYLAEKPLNELPILVDVDLKTRTKSTKSAAPLFNLAQVKRIVQTFQTALRDRILVNVPNENLVCILLEKDPRVQEKNEIHYVKHGFHLHFPKCFVDVMVQKAYLVPIVKKCLEGMFDHLYTLDNGQSTESANTSESSVHYNFIDDASTTAHWLMYGSRKLDGEPYLATRCFDANGNEQSFEDCLGNYVLPRLKGQTRPVSCEGRVIELLPQILSTRLHGRSCYYFKPRPSVNTPVITEFYAVKSKRTDFVQRSVTETLSEAERLIELLSSSRADNRSDWLTIGYCLHNITQGDDDGLSAWMAFSEQSEKYNEAECICMWQNEMRENSYTIGTLKYYAKLDSPEEYDRMCREKGKSLIDKAVDGGHNDMAKILYNEYQNEFVFSPTGSQWFHFNGNIWEEVKTCFALSERISNNNGAIISQFDAHVALARAKLRQMGKPVTVASRRPKRVELEDEEDEELEQVADKLRKKIAVIEKLIQRCKNSPFKASVMKECQEVFRNEMFSKKLNTNPYLVAFKNGVYDFKNDCFRNGKPEDYLSVSTAIEYKDYKSVDHPKVMKVVEFFRKVFPNEEIRRYFLDQACQLFIGGNHDKVFCVWTGTGENGKSITQSLFEKMLGSLAVKISTSLITGGKARMGQAAPELARTGNGVRWVVMDEPSKDEQITTGTLKAITGGDSYYARDLYEGGKGTKEINPLYRLHMLCNHLPTIRNPDEACWERVRVIPFESKFLPESRCPKLYEEQVAQKVFPKDSHFKDKIDGLLQPLAWYLIYHLRGLSKKNRQVPDKVRIATASYREENNNDPVQEFMDDELVRADCEELSVDELVNRYRDWWRANYSGEKLTLTKKAIIANISKLMGDVSEVKTRGGICKKVIKGYGWQKFVDVGNDNPLL